MKERFGIRRAAPLRFGIEGEVLLARAEDFTPLWHEQLDFFELVDLLESIPTNDVARDGLRRERPHPSALPYVVEGYDVPAPGNPDLPVERLPKGLEIRTPVCDSVTRAVELYAILFDRLRRALLERGLVPVHVSHHPHATRFAGPRNSRRTDWWRWQMAAMTTYGPDVNLGLPPARFARIDARDLERKLNHYAPAMVAFSLNSPIHGGSLWRPRAATKSGPPAAYGKSARTYFRSLHAPPLLILPEEDGRLEFKAFDTTRSLADLENDLLLFAAVVLDERLGGRASDAERVQRLRRLAVEGWDAPGVSQVAAELLDAAERCLVDHALDPSPLTLYRRRLESRWVPADDTAATFVETGSIAAVLRASAGLLREDPLAVAEGRLLAAAS